MKCGDVIMEKMDYLALKKILNFHKYYHDYLQKEALDMLKVRLENAKICDTSEIPEGTVRLYSNVSVVFHSGKKHRFQLVLEPDDEKNGEKVSVRSILGATLVGRSAGDKITVPSKEPMTIEKVEWMAPKDKISIP